MGKPIGKEALEMIKRFEGCRLQAYKCPAGVWTIGYGHTAGVKQGQVITQAQADAFLIADCQKFADYVDNPAYVPITYSLNDNQRDALISFTYNCGAGSLKTLCKGRTAAQIADKILLYDKAAGKVLAGLTKRRKAERELFLRPAENVVSNGMVKQPEQEGEEYKMDTIRKGSKGKVVKVWQIIVGVNPDGIFGSGTETATRTFQKQQGLSVDGIVGEKSWRIGLDSL